MTFWNYISHQYAAIYYCNIQSGLGTGFGFLLTTGWRQREAFVSWLTSNKIKNKITFTLFANVQCFNDKGFERAQNWWVLLKVGFEHNHKRHSFTLSRCGSVHLKYGKQATPCSLRSAEKLLQPAEKQQTQKLCITRSGLIPTTEKCMFHTTKSQGKDFIIIVWESLLLGQMQL